MTVYRQLHPDAPPVPKGLQPKPGVEYGCGDPKCRKCYEVIPRYVLREGDIHKENV
jgi:NAD-dependent dihydropyrimidine dehydrogenase PreA subunit